MAASKKIDSCSLMASRPTNPNSRNSEICNPMRRSFSGSPMAKPSIVPNQRGGGFNPNTPINSPSDYPRRNSISSENIIVTLLDYEEKENGKNQTWKSAKVCPPAKGAKNFMSPTISAASKMNASPRKKILADRNEQIRTSMLFADGKSPLMEDLDSKSDKGLNQKKEVSFDSTVTYLGDSDDSKSEELVDFPVDSSAEDDLDLTSHNLTAEKDCVNLDPSFKITPSGSCSLQSSALAPLDADPSMPPYDPKINYLSPRPRFVHYRPNPRIALYHNKKRDGQPTEEIFASECFSETEASEEAESHSDDSQKESSASSEMEVKGSDVSSCDEEKEGKEEEMEEQQQLVSGPNPISNSVEKADEKRVSKSIFVTRKFATLLLVLAVGFLYVSVSESPVMDRSVFNNWNFPEPYVPPELSEFARQSFKDLTQKLQLCVHHSLCYTHNLINSFRGRANLGPLHYANLTILLEDGLVADGQFAFDQSILGAEVVYQENFLGRVREDMDESVEEVDDDNNEWDLGGVPDSEDVDAPGSEEVSLLPNTEVTKPSNSAQEVNHESAAVSADTVVDQQSNMDLEDQPVLTPKATEIESEIANSSPPQGDTSSAESAETVVDQQSNMDLEDQPVLTPKATEIESEIANSSPPQGHTSSADIQSPVAEKNLEMLSDAVEENPQSSELASMTSAQITVGIFLLVFIVLGTAFIYTKNQTPTTTLNQAFKVNEVPVTKKKLDCSPVVAVHTEDEVGESCPSEMSSFSLSDAKKGQKGISEARSYESNKPRKNSYRRESMASSDYFMGSPSYGSFTTYEKIPGKHANEKEEVITPVRRSSRIKSQVPSS